MNLPTHRSVSQRVRLAGCSFVNQFELLWSRWQQRAALLGTWKAGLDCEFPRIPNRVTTLLVRWVIRYATPSLGMEPIVFLDYRQRVAFAFGLPKLDVKLRALGKETYKYVDVDQESEKCPTRTRYGPRLKLEEATI